MNSISSYIQNQILVPRLKRNGVLVVYDKDRRYRDICLNLDCDTVRVVDASESSIISRETALRTLNELGRTDTNVEGLIVYVPTGAPLTDEEKQVDPFSLYMVCGSTFPESDGDEYQSLCIKFKPNYQTEIRKIFGENPNPSFDVIDAISGGIGWPNLQTLLKADSAQEIISALLVPSESQIRALDTQDAWVSEAKDLFKKCLGLKLITRGKTWSSIADELWRFLLFSEFVFDTPVEVPDTLSLVPHAANEAKPLVENICDRLRSDRRTKETYIDRAEAIEKELVLPTHCAALTDLGVKETFPFEERWFFAQAINALRDDDMDRVRVILGRHASSVWEGKGESEAQWGVLRTALSLCQTCDDLERQYSDNTRSLDSLIDFYITVLREADRIQREFQQSIACCIDVDKDLGDIIERTQKRYRRLSSVYHTAFMRHIEKQGWPPESRLANVDIFDRYIAPKLQESGRKVAYLLIDALRYELGVELEKQLNEDAHVQLIAASAQLPSITSVGMASLLPEAEKDLALVIQDNELFPILNGTRVSSVNQRMNIFHQRYGQRFAEMTLADLIKGKIGISPTTDLIVIRSAEIDTDMEANPETALRQINDTLKKVRVAINKLRGFGFNDIIIATDHGFFLNTQSEPGDVASKPVGNWVNVHERILLGSGSGDSANLVIASEKIGIRGNIPQMGSPYKLVPYRAGVRYFHGGVSLQECIVPVITIRSSESQPDLRKPIVTVSYKAGAKRITTRLPAIDVQIESHDLFSGGTEFEILLEAQDKKGNVVGEAKPGGGINPMTGTITLKPGDRTQIILKMQTNYQGKFSVLAMNPNTFEIYSKIELETDYLV